MSQRRQSQIINNFFTLASIIIIAVVLVLYTKYIRPGQEVKALTCESESFTKTKVYNQELLNSSIRALEDGNFQLKASYKIAKYSKSTIQSFISLNEINSYFKEAINIQENIKTKPLSIKYSLIEFDKKDPRRDRKNDLRSGSLYISFKAGASDIFKFYTDFKFYNKEEIKQRVLCSIKVYKNHAR